MFSIYLSKRRVGHFNFNYWFLKTCKIGQLHTFPEKTLLLYIKFENYHRLYIEFEKLLMTLEVNI